MANRSPNLLFVCLFLIDIKANMIRNSLTALSRQKETILNGLKVLKTTQLVK